MNLLFIVGSCRFCFLSIILYSLNSLLLLSFIFISFYFFYLLFCSCQVPEMLGVSAAILDNVIFCHQVPYVRDMTWILDCSSCVNNRILNLNNGNEIFGHCCLHNININIDNITFSIIHNSYEYEYIPFLRNSHI